MPSFISRLVGAEALVDYGGNYNENGNSRVGISDLSVDCSGTA